MTSRRFLSAILLLLPLLTSASTTDAAISPHTYAGKMESSIILSEPEIAVAAHMPRDVAIKPIEKTREQRWWWNQLVYQRSLNLQDTSILYPKFIKFCVDAYNWGDRFFNSYDPEFVVGTGKRWKARIVNDNWVDSYVMTLPSKLQANMLSNLYANLGGYIQYMAVSVGYTIDVGKYFGNNPLNHKKWEFGFNCARFNAEIYYQENTGGTYLRQFGKYNNGRLFKQEFPGLEMYNFGLQAVYFINNRRYSHGAAYNFSKIQKQTQGSLIAGLSYSNIKLRFDFSKLPADLLPYLTIPAESYLFHYNSYAAVVGYGFNWVINPRLLYNVTVMPAFGVAHCFEDSLEGEKYMFAMNMDARMSFTYNLGNWFFSLIGKLNGHWYKSGTYSLFSSVENFSANIGIRF
ncbi:MAG: DUF4421 domain-containing protein [Muribaculaceae bacterium]|nr:DUF4421 domain-containing protein [Muribaculaceae bacterium]